MKSMSPKEISRLVCEDISMPQHLVEQGVLNEPPEGPSPDMGAGEPGPDIGEPDEGPEEQAIAEPVTIDRELLVMLLKYAKTGERPEPDMPEEPGMPGEEGPGDEGPGEEPEVRFGESILKEYPDMDFGGGDEGGGEEDMGGDEDLEGLGDEGAEEGLSDDEIEGLVDAVVAHGGIEGEPGIPGEEGEGKVMTAEDFDEILDAMEANGAEEPEFGEPGEEPGVEPGEGPPPPPPMGESRLPRFKRVV